MTRVITADSTYLDRLASLIPAEIVAAHLAVQDIVYNQPGVRDISLEVSAVFLLLLLPFYLRFARAVRSKLQIGVTMVSFLVWVVAVSAPFYQRISVDATLGTVALILWTTAIPAFPIRGRSPE